MLIKKKFWTALLAAILITCSFAPIAKAKINVKKAAAFTGYTSLGAGTAFMGIYFAMLAYALGGMRSFTKPTTSGHLANAFCLSALPVFASIYTSYRMLRHAYKITKK